jgi:hypothetical protein
MLGRDRGGRGGERAGGDIASYDEFVRFLDLENNEFFRDPRDATATCTTRSEGGRHADSAGNHGDDVNMATSLDRAKVDETTADDAASVQEEVLARGDEADIFADGLSPPRQVQPALFAKTHHHKKNL